jgi:CBS domain-containing protein
MDPIVADHMSTTVQTCPADATLQAAVETMLREAVGSVIVVRDGEPAGIVTETDALEAGAATGEAFTAIPVSRAASHPLVTIEPTATIGKAVRRMREEKIKKLAVVSDLDLQGVLTVSDVATHYDDFRKEARRIERQRERWEAPQAEPGEF